MPDVREWQPPKENPWTAEDVALLVKVGGSLGIALVIVLLSFVLVLITNRDWQGWLAIILPVTTYFVGHHQGSGAGTGRRKHSRRG
jgi:apolipoprotein N-acyltransferase